MQTQSSRQVLVAKASARGSRGVQLIGAGLVAVLATTVYSGITDAKTPGSTYCFYGKCHRVKSLSETEALVGQEMTIATSFYDSCKSDRYNPCGLTSSGEVFRPDRADNAASPIYPDGTKLLVWSPDSGAAAIIRVNNAGPYWGNRKLDVSKATADKLGFSGSGVANLVVRVLDAPTSEEATYRKNRTYEPVPGYIGTYASADGASQGAAELMALEALARRFNNRLPDKQKVVAAAKAEILEENRSKTVSERQQRVALAAADRQAVIAKAATMGAVNIPILKDLVEIGTEIGDAILGSPAPKAKVKRVARVKYKARREMVADRAKTERVYVRKASRKSYAQAASNPQRREERVSQAYRGREETSYRKQRKAESREKRRSRDT